MIEPGAGSINCNAGGSNVEISLIGSIDATNLEKVESTFDKLLGDGSTKIIVDCRELNFICSAGLGALVANLDDARRLGGDMKLVGVRPEIYKVFAILGFNKTFEFFDTMDDARKAFSGQ